MDATGGLALLEKTSLVEDQDGVRLDQGLDDVLAHDITQGVGVPLAAPEHFLLPPWSGITGGLGPHPAGLAPFRPELGTRLKQLELAIEALEVDEAERLAGTSVIAEARKAVRLRPARWDLPAHLPRESVVHAGPCACPACVGNLRRIGEDVTESLDYVLGRFKLVRHVRAAFACRICEQVVQAPARHHAVPRGRAGPGLLAHIAVAKFDDHLPLYRQAEIYARDGVELATSTLSG